MRVRAAVGEWVVEFDVQCVSVVINFDFPECACGSVCLDRWWMGGIQSLLNVLIHLTLHPPTHTHMHTQRIKSAS